MLLVEAGSMKWHKYVEFKHRLIGFDRVILKYSDYSLLKPIRMEESILFSMFYPNKYATWCSIHLINEDLGSSWVTEWIIQPPVIEIGQIMGILS